MTNSTFPLISFILSFPTIKKRRRPVWYNKTVVRYVQMVDRVRQIKIKAKKMRRRARRRLGGRLLTRPLPPARARPPPPAGSPTPGEGRGRGGGSELLPPGSPEGAGRGGGVGADLGSGVGRGGAGQRGAGSRRPSPPPPPTATADCRGQAGGGRGGAVRGSVGSMYRAQTCMYSRAGPRGAHGHTHVYTQSALTNSWPEALRHDTQTSV